MEDVGAARDGASRETCLRLALLRQSNGSSRPLDAVLSVFPSVSAALARWRFLDAPLRDCLAPLCVDEASLRGQVASDCEAMARAGATLLYRDDPGYPPLLAEIPAPPPVLFCRGDAAVLSQPQIAIVGSRHASPAGLATARAFATDLARAGFVITSGLALGIDGMAHEGALQAPGGSTVAVLGCGIDVTYPRRHHALAGRIPAAGCILTEYLPGTPPLPGQFPLRNRIISGLSLGVLVVEAAPDSGSLITARFALEQGREVFAVPGSIHSPMSRGCHQLIREGALLVETSAQVVEALSHFALPLPATICDAGGPDAPAAGRAAPEAARLLRALSPAGSAVDDLVAATGWPAARIGSLLAELAVEGRVHPLPGGRWQPAG